MPWTIKYKPKNLNEFVNHHENVDQFLKWMDSWQLGEKALLFYGQPGTGKTALIQAYANEYKLELIEMNASDYRSAKQIQEVLGQSMKQTSLFKRGKIFLIDEIDGIAGREDTGGTGEIIEIIKESKFPIILTANNAYDPKLRSLRTHCELVEFKKLSVYDIEKKLKQICDKEGIKTDEMILRQLSHKSNGDMRSAINDLELISQGRKEIGMNDIEELGLRERETNIFEALKIIFKTQNVSTAREAINGVDKDPGEIFFWIENNIINEYEDSAEIAKAFDMLSEADLFRARISYRQNWRLMGYMIDLMTAGVAVSKKEMYRKFSRYQYPQNIMILGRTKEDRKALKEVLSKLSKQLHCSSRKIKSQYMPYFEIMMKNKKFKKDFPANFSLNEEEMDALK